MQITVYGECEPLPTTEVLMQGLATTLTGDELQACDVDVVTAAVLEGCSAGCPCRSEGLAEPHAVRRRRGVYVVVTGLDVSDLAERVASRIATMLSLRGVHMITATGTNLLAFPGLHPSNWKGEVAGLLAA